MIFDGDIITLKDNAKIIFNINKHIKAEVQGPAKFTIIKLSEKKYRLSLIDGSYLKIDGEKDSDALQVETDEVLVSTEKNEALALELTKANKKTQIKNTGASLLVKNKKSKVEEQPTTLKTAKLLTMQDDDIASITDVDHFQDVFTTKKNLTHTVTLSGVSSGERVLSQEVFKDGLLSFSGTDMEFLVHK